MVHSLIHGYGLLNKLKIVQTSPSSYDNLQQFHSKRYLGHLRTFTEVGDEYMASKVDEEHGIGMCCGYLSVRSEPYSNLLKTI